MTVAAAVKIDSHDLALRVIPNRLRLNGSRHIDRGKFTLAQQKTMKVTTCVTVAPDNVASRIDPQRDGENGSRYIDGRKCAVAQQKP